MGAQVFVYYTVDAADGAGARARIRHLQSELAGRYPGLVTELLARDDEDADGRRTWMETYRRPGGVDADCQAAIASAAEVLSGRLTGPRHTEVFVEVEMGVEVEVDDAGADAAASAGAGAAHGDGTS